MRLFLAVNLPEDARRRIYAATAPLRDVAPSISWVREPLLHLTLKFLGEQPPEMAERVRESILPVASGLRPIPIVLGAIGAFPSFRRPNVVWMGVEPERKLELLHHDVEVVCSALGFEVEGRPFRPHLTLARVRQRAGGVEARRALARAAREIQFEEEIVVSSIDLMQSDLSAASARYTLIASAPLVDA